MVLDSNDSACRSSDFKPIFRFFDLFTESEDDCNKKRTSKNTNPSCVVAGAGLEPATFGL